MISKAKLGSWQRCRAADLAVHLGTDDLDLNPNDSSDLILAHKNLNRLLLRLRSKQSIAETNGRISRSASMPSTPTLM